jgi:uncharacterized protein
MKFLLLLVVVWVAVWAWRSGRLANAQPKQKTKPPSQPQDMVSCTLCGVHFPQADAVPGRNGPYCCTEHQQRAES